MHGPEESGSRAFLLKLQLLVDLPECLLRNFQHLAVVGHETVELFLHVGDLRIYRRGQPFLSDVRQHLPEHELFVVVRERRAGAADAAGAVSVAAAWGVGGATALLSVLVVCGAGS